MKRFQPSSKEASADAVQVLADEGLQLPDRPDFEQPMVPTDLTTIDDSNLMQLFAELTAWTDYLMGQLACAEIDERRVLRMVSETESYVMTKLGESETKTSVTQLKAQIDLDPDVQSARDAAGLATAYRKLVSVLADTMERDAALISRELTRRTIPVNQRSVRWV